MNELFELKETLCKELEEYGRKKEMKAGDLEVIDKLTHTIKNLDKIIENYGENEYSGARGRGSNARRDSRGRYSSEYARENYSNAMGNYDAMGNMRGGNYSNRGYSNERGNNYSMRGGYSNANDMVMELRELMEDAPDERTRMEFEKFIRKVENM